jgi:tRNA threonylcarbamoyladenosine biosynthesis protein TsaB
VTILAVDTTAETGSIAIRSHSETVIETELQSPDGFAHVLFGVLDQALRSAGLRLQDIDCFAAASGPGSFTGVRVGLSAVKGLAESLAKPAVAISNLKALASFGSLPLRAVCIDARRGQIYGAVYDSDLQLVEPETVLKLAEWLDTLRAPEYEIISRLSPDVFRNTHLAAMPFRNPPLVLADAIARCAEKAPWIDPIAIDANYIRRSDAELFWKDV